jgi:predicted SnoaL-like aldol condensation-catalyzing enzyme
MKKTLLPAVFFASLILFAATSIAQLPVQPLSDQKTLLQSSDPKLAQNKKLLYDFWREVFEGRPSLTLPISIWRKLTSSTILMCQTGRKAFVDFFSKFKKPEPIADTIKAPVVAIIAEGDMVMISFARELVDPKDATKKYSTTWFDMFRIENGKIAEHWDAATKQ